MVALFIDGFDKYGPASQNLPTVASMLLAGEWNTVSNPSNTGIAAGLSGTGLALSLGGATTINIQKTLATNYARLIGGVRFSSSNLAQPSGLACFMDGTSYQASIVVNTSGQIVLYRGQSGGTVLGTAAGSVTAGSTHYVEWDITFGASSPYQVWLDGVSVISGTGQTRTTANNYANGLRLSIEGGGGSNTTFNLDDLYLFDNTGATCNAVLNNNPIVETAFPSADSAKVWTAGAAIIGTDNCTSTLQNAPGANILFLRQYTAAQNMTLNSISCVPNGTNGSAKFRPALYGPMTQGAQGTHRYWRLLINSVSAGANISIAELQFREVAGTPQTFSGGTASASTTNGASVASNATDSNISTIWQATASTGWWQYDYGVGVAKNIAQVTMTNSAANTGAPTNFDLQYSDDGITWNEASNFNASWTSGNQVLTFTQTFPILAGNPGSALIAQGNEVVGTTGGATLTATFSSGQALTAGVQYAIGFFTDTSVNMNESDTGTVGVKVANTYSSGAPSVLPTPTTGQNNWQIWGNCTSPATNYAALNLNPPIDDISYNWSATVNQEDLYGFPNLSNNPASISCVAYKGRIKRSDSGSRSVEMHCASGSADTAGSTAGGVFPASSFQWIGNYLPTDPNTGLAWTGSGTNAATAGPKVFS